MDGGYATCGGCNGEYHYACANIREQSWLSTSAPNKKKWRCVTCKGPSTPSTNTGSGGQQTSQTQPQREDVTMQKIEALMDKKFTVFLKKMQEMEEGITFVGNTVEEIKNDFKSMQKKIIEIDNRQEKLEQQNQELRKKVKDMEVFIQDMAQEKNGNKVEITGIPQDVDCKVFTEKIFQAAKVDQIVNSSEYKIEKNI